MGEEIMKFKKIMFVSILLLAILTIGAVSASDDNVTDGLAVSEDSEVGSSMENVEIISNQDYKELIGNSHENDNLKMDTDFNVEFSQLIDNTPENGTLELEKDYEIRRGDEVIISKSITIDGKNHVFSGSTPEILFTIAADNVVLKNIVFMDSYPNNPLIVGGTLENCTFINFYRHAIFTNGTAYNCNFINTSGRAVDTALGVYNSCFVNCSGGAVYDTPVYNCSFVNCSSEYGGAVDFYYLYNGTVADCRFINCSATGNGGAVYYQHKYRISNCTFEDCSCIGGAVVANADVIGCSFVNTVGSCVDRGNAYNSTFTNAFSSEYGAGLFKGSSYNSTFINCSASADGGAIYEGNCYSSTFINCSAVNGGAFYSINKKSIHDSYFEGCHAEEGGAVYGWFNGFENYRVSVYNSTFLNCCATQYGGALSQCKVFDSSFVNCHSDNGGALCDCDVYNSNVENCGANLGGAAYNTYSYNSTFKNCSSLSDGGAIYGYCGAENSTFINCSSQSNGGAIYCKEQCEIDECSFVDCSAANNAGAVYLGGWECTILNSTFIRCVSENEAGAVYDVIVRYSRFENCTSKNGFAVSESYVYKCIFINSYIGNTNISVIVKNTDLNEDAIINISVEDIADGFAAVTVNGSLYDVNITDGMGSLSISNLSIGKYFVNVTCYPNGYYPVSQNANFEVKDLYDTNITLTTEKRLIPGNGILTVTLDERINGSVTVQFEDITRNVEIVNGQGKFELKDLYEGVWYVKIIFAGDNDFSAKTVNNFFRVYEDPNLRAYPSNSYSTSDDIIFRIKLDSQSYSDDNYVNIKVISGNDTVAEQNVSHWEYNDAYPNVGKLDVGEYSLVVSYGGYGEYGAAQLIKTFKVLPDPNIVISVDNVTYGEMAVVNVSINENANGSLIFEIDNVVYDIILYQGKGSYNISNLTLGRHHVEINYYDYVVFGYSYVQAFFDVVKVMPEVIIPSLDNVSANATIEIIFPEDATGSGTFRISMIDYSFDVVGGKTKFTLPDLAEGEYYYTVFYYGSPKYSVFTSSGTMKINSKGSDVAGNSTVEPKITIPNLDESSSDATVEISLPADAAGTVTLTVDGKDYVFDVVNGKADVKLPELTDGNHPYTITYSGDSKYSSVTNNGSLKVNKTNVGPVENQTNSTVNPNNKTDNNPAENSTSQENTTVVDNSKIVASNVNVVYSAGSYYTITVYGTNGELADGETVKVTGKISKSLTTTNGVARFKVTNVPGTYKINITALGKSVVKTLTVKHLVTLKSVTVKKSAKKLTLQATLGKVNGKYLKNKKITFKFNGKKYTAKTDKKGVAKVTIKSSVLKKLKVGKKVTYQATYSKDTVKKTVKVKK